MAGQGEACPATKANDACPCLSCPARRTHLCFERGIAVVRVGTSHRLCPPLLRHAYVRSTNSPVAGFVSIMSFTCDFTGSRLPTPELLGCTRRRINFHGLVDHERCMTLYFPILSFFNLIVCLRGFATRHKQWPAPRCHLPGGRPYPRLPDVPRTRSGAFVPCFTRS